MSGITALAANLFAGLTLTLAPVPPEPKPDPLGRGYMGVWFWTSPSRSTASNRTCPARRPGCARAT